ncbi:MAG: hypothetical protein RJA20_1627 [Bacteroidota bacterium]|jgi:hypothetical protein
MGILCTKTGINGAICAILLCVNISLILEKKVNCAYSITISRMSGVFTPLNPGT